MMQQLFQKRTHDKNESEREKMKEIETLITTQRLNIVEATKADVDTIIEIESHKDNRDYIWIGTAEQHLAEIEDPEHLLLLFHTTRIIICY